MDDPKLPQGREELALFLQQLAHQPPRNPHLDNGPWDFLSRCDPEVQEQEIRPVLHELLVARDPVVREHAVRALMRLPRSDNSFDRLVEVATQARPLFEGKLGKRLQHALSNLSATPERERRAAETIMLLAGSDVPIVGSLIGQWLPDYAVELAARFGRTHDDAGFWCGLVVSTALYRRDALLKVLSSLSGLPKATKELIWSDLEPRLGRDDAHISGLCRAEGIPPPTRPAPSKEEARRCLMGS